jgi:hypothetical protein
VPALAVVAASNRTETYFLLVIMTADAHAGPFFAVSSIMLMWNLVKF